MEDGWAGSQGGGALASYNGSVSFPPLSAEQPASAGRSRPERESDPTAIFRPEELYSTFRRDRLGQLEGFSGWALAVERGAQTGRTYLLPDGATRVGRDRSSRILLDDITVSRRHCLVRVDEDRVTVEDEGSTNGTYVNGARMEVSPLHPGDRLMVGRFHLVLVRGQ